MNIEMIMKQALPVPVHIQKSYCGKSRTSYKV